MTVDDTVMDLGTREAHEDELTRLYPEASICYGTYTHEWIAFVTDAGGTVRRLKADNPFELAHQLDATRTPFPDHLEPKPAVKPARHRHARTRRRNRLLR